MTALETFVAPAGEAEFFAELGRRHRLAVERRGLVTRALSIAGHRVSLDFAGSALSDILTNSLVNAGDESGQLGAAIGFWDSASTGVEPPRAPCGFASSLGYGRGVGGGVRLGFCPVSSTLQVTSPDGAQGHYWVRRKECVPAWECAAPFRSLLAWWAESAGAVLAHAAVVGSPHCGIMLVGASGAGKSTSALACASAGMGFLGDDCAVLRIENGEPEAHALYRTAKVAKSLLEGKLSALRALETDLVHDRGKAILRFDRNGSRMLVRSRIRAVVVQGFGAGVRSRLRPTSAAQALRALAPSTLLQSPGTGQRALAVLASVVARTPCFALDAGHDLRALADTISELCS